MSDATERANLKRKKITDIQREKVEVEEAGLLPFHRINHRNNRGVARTTISCLPPLTTILRCDNCSEIARGGQGGGGVDPLPRKLERVVLVVGPALFASKEAFSHIRQLLHRVVNMEDRKRWEIVDEQPFFQDVLNSYLQFRTRWYDLLQPGKEKEFLLHSRNCTSVDAAVMYLLEEIFHELQHQKCDSNYLQGLCLLEISLNKKMIELPLLLDMIAIFGYDAADSWPSRVATDAIEVLPKLGKDFTNAMNTFLSIVHSLLERCKMVLTPAEDGTPGSYQVAKECLEVLNFINDAIYTLSSFVPAYKGAAYLVCHTDAQRSQCKRLLNTLAMIHDSLLPALLLGIKGTSVPPFASDSRSKEIEDIDSGISRLSHRVVWFAASLMDYYLKFSPGPAVLKEALIKFDPPAVRVSYLIRTLGDMLEAPPETFWYSDCAKLGGFVRALEADQHISEKIRTFFEEAHFQLRAWHESILAQLHATLEDPDVASVGAEVGDVVMASVGTEVGDVVGASVGKEVGDVVMGD